MTRAKARRNGGGDLPASDDVASDSRTHDANEQMLAEQYRRGLRVCGNRCFQTNSLDFLFEDEE